MNKNNAIVKIYPTDDSKINELSNEIFEMIQFREDFGLGIFDGKINYFPNIVTQLGSYKECYSREIPRDIKMLDFYIPEYKNLHIIGHIYFSYLAEICPIIYLEMFFSDSDYNSDEYGKMCFCIDASTIEDYNKLYNTQQNK